MKKLLKKLRLPLLLVAALVVAAAFMTADSTAVPDLDPCLKIDLDCRADGNDGHRCGSYTHVDGYEVICRLPWGAPPPPRNCY